ncbi:MAG: SDR family oxidoreductase [Candidatus Omnitrophica bacterium]|nr:SDR family oxidoreductase [Candidatus Omnitrophota bacterium]
MSVFNFQNKTAVVTGGTRGIGRAVAKGLLESGAKVIVTGTKESPAWLNNYPRAQHMTLDFLKENSLSSFMASFPPEQAVDILINNAGIHIPKPFTELTQQDWEDIMRINIIGPADLINKMIPFMRKNVSGNILNMSSIAGFIARPGSTAYSASKSALNAFTRSLALELAKDNIKVNALCPGTTETDMVKEQMDEDRRKHFLSLIPMQRFALPEEIAQWALFLCSDLNTYMTGQTVIVDGGATIQ